MKITRLTWITLCLAAAVSVGVWFRFSYPQLAVADFSVDRAHATRIAEDYLKDRRGVDPAAFRHAVIFSMDGGTNRYLQKTLGFKGMQAFIKQHDFDMFFWLVRFFKENTKEEYLLEISSSTGEVIGFVHTIDENDARRETSREEARENAQAFLKSAFKNFDFENATLRSNFAVHRDNRSDFIFSWQKNSVSIPWSREPDSGTGKLLIKVKISGDEVLAFNKNIFMIPEGFKRDMAGRKEPSRNIMVVVQMLVLGLFVFGIYLIITRQNHLAMHTTKRFYIALVAVSFLLSLLAGLNQYQQILYSYSTTLSFAPYLGRYAINTVVSALFVTIAMLIPSLAGELLHYESPAKRKEGSFLTYARSTFTSRPVAASILLGYLVGIILLGLQSLLLKIGQAHLGVWIEHKWIDNISTAYLPFLAAFTIGYKASLSEEIMYRLYAINLGRKIMRKINPGGRANIWIVGAVSSLIWGFAHSNYPIFPTWFRGIEVTCLGFFLAFIYCKFGLIPVIVGHYLVDVFWNGAGYIFGTSTPFYFTSSLAVLLVPLALAGAAFALNRKEEERPLRWHLNAHQLYNLGVLKAHFNAGREHFAPMTDDQVKAEITPHGWDPAVVEVALEDFRGKHSGD